MIVDDKSFDGLSDAHKVFREQPCGSLAIVQRDTSDLAGHDRAPAPFHVRRSPLAHVEPEDRDVDVARLGTALMLREKPRGFRARFVVGAKRVKVLHPGRFDLQTARGARIHLQPLALDVHRPPECRHAGQTIDDRIVVGLGQRFAIARLGGQPPGARIGRIVGRCCSERELKVAVCFERIAGLAAQLERGGQAERGLVGDGRSARRLARAAIQRDGVVEGPCVSERLGRTQEQVRGGSRAKLAEAAQCRLEIAGRQKCGDRLAPGEAGDNRLASRNRLPERSAFTRAPG